MNYSELKVRTSVFIFIIFSALLLLFSISVWASQEELDEVKNAIESKDAHWVAGETSVSKLSPEERRARLGAEKPILMGSEALSLLEEAAAAPPPPASLDWRNYNGYMFITPVRNQGGCGSCWAFATTAALESYVLITQNTPGANVNLSEQTLVSCGGAGNCGGGSPSIASYYIMNTGLPAETCFSYTATDPTTGNPCSNACSGYQTNTYRIHNWHWVTTSAPTVSAIKNALYTYGPLVTTMDVYSDFFNYRTGIYSYVSGTRQGGHAILLVGYDDGSGYFVAKNSWGTGWGEAGYFKIAYSELSSVVQFGYYTIAYDSPPASIPTASAPAVAWNPTLGKYHVAIRRADNKIYIGTANVDGVLNFDFQQLPTGKTGVKPAIAWDPVHNKVVIAVKGNGADTSMWVSNMNADGTGFSGWTLVPAGTTASPAIAWNSSTGKVQYAILTSTNTIFLGSMANNGTGFSQLPLAGTVGSPPSITIGTGGTVYLATKDTTARNRVRVASANPNTFAAITPWTSFINGSTTIAPSVAWNSLTNKLELVVRGGVPANSVFKVGIPAAAGIFGAFGAWTQVVGAVSTDVPAAGMDPLLAPLNIFTLNAGNVSGYVTPAP